MTKRFCAILGCSETEFLNLSTQPPVPEPEDEVPVRDVSLAGSPTLPADVAVGQGLATPTTARTPPLGIEQDEQLVIDFMGREKEKRHICDALRNPSLCRVALIHGMPGLGKTQLALAAAESLRDDFPDGQIHVKLQTADGRRCTPSEVQFACVRKLRGVGVEPPENEAGLLHMYRNSLESKRVLIVADNAADSEQVTWLVPPKGSALVVTSRSILAFRESVTRVCPDNFPEAAVLIKRLCDAVPDGVAEKLAELCGKLPLAIRAAGTLLAVTRDLDPLEYATQLEDERTRLETLGHHGVPIGIAASFNISYSRLGPGAAAAFGKLGVFPATFDRAAAEAICVDCANALSDLTRHALVFYNEKTRRYWLHDLMRLFALKKLREVADAEVEARQRHADHFSAVLNSASGLYKVETEAYRQGLDLFERERDNILASWSWCADRAPLSLEDAKRCSRFGAAAGLLVNRHVPLPDRLKRFEASVAASRMVPVDSATLAINLHRLAEALYHTGEAHNYDLAIERLHEQENISSSPFLKSAAFLELGNLHMALEPRDERTALRFHERAERLSRKTDDVSFRIRTKARLALTCFANFQKARARALFEEALMHAGTEYARARLYTLNFLAQMEIRCHKFRAGRVAAREALELALLFKDTSAESAAVVHLARIARETGRLREARERFERSLRLNTESGNSRRIAGAYLEIGVTYRKMRHFQEAHRALTEAERLSRRIGWSWCANKCEQELAAVSPHLEQKEQPPPGTTGAGG